MQDMEELLGRCDADSVQEAQRQIKAKLPALYQLPLHVPHVLKRDERRSAALSEKFTRHKSAPSHREAVRYAKDAMTG